MRTLALILIICFHPSLRAELLPLNMQPRQVSDRELKVLELSEAERDTYKINIVNGLLYDQKGQLIDTVNNENLNNQRWWETPQYAIWVMDLKGNLYISLNYNESDDPIDRSIYRFHHSSFFPKTDDSNNNNTNEDNTHAIAGAGKIKVDQGKLLVINNYSGHYHTSEAHLDKVVRELQKDIPYSFAKSQFNRKDTSACDQHFTD